MKLEQALLEQIRCLTGLFYDESYLLEHADFGTLQPDIKLFRLEDGLRAVQNRLASLERKKEILYEDRLEGIISTELFTDFLARQETEAESLRLRQQTLTAEISAMAVHKSTPPCAAEHLEHYRTPDSLTRDMTDLLVESVHVFKRRKGEPQKITINWNF